MFADASESVNTFLRPQYGHGNQPNLFREPDYRIQWQATQETSANKDSICYTYWVIGSAIMSGIIHHVASPYICGKFLPTYSRLSYDRRMEWDSRVLSTLHAICVCYFGICSLLGDFDIWNNPITHYSHEGYVALAIAAGYMICDLISMPFYWRGVSLIAFSLHHVFVLMAAYLIINYRAGVFFGVFRLMSELSTPALNLRWFLRVMGRSSGNRTVAWATFAFLFTFVFGRYVTVFYFWHVIYSWWNSEMHLDIARRHTYIPELGIGLGILLDLLNVIWGRKVFLLAWRTYVTQRKKTAAISKPSSTKEPSSVVISNGATRRLVAQ